MTSYCSSVMTDKLILVLLQHQVMTFVIGDNGIRYKLSIKLTNFIFIFMLFLFEFFIFIICTMKFNKSRKIQIIIFSNSILFWTASMSFWFLGRLFFASMLFATITALCKLLNYEIDPCFYRYKANLFFALSGLCSDILFISVR